MIRFITLILISLFTVAFGEESTRTGHIETFSFISEYLENERTIWVYLPPEYASNPTGHYPVFYLQDGQNLMDGNTAFKKGHEWKVDETAEELILKKEITPVILVGIDHMNEQRAYEYNVLQELSQGAGQYQNQGGGGELYGYMILEELMPLINKKYRTKAGPENTAVGGASFGCNISLYLALEYPDTFGHGMGMSCATWFAGRWLNKLVRGKHKKSEVKVWLDLGDEEYDNKNWSAAEVARHKELYESFLSRGWQEDKDIKFLIAENAHHFEDDWAKRFPLVLKYFFAPEASK